MLNLFELDEMDGLTPAHVEAWALSVGYQPCGKFSGCSRFTRDRNDRPEFLGLSQGQIFVGDAQNLQSSLLLLAERENVTLQELLRRINPRWRRCTPTDDEIAWHLQVHGGLWLRRTSTTPAGSAARIFSSPALVRLVSPLDQAARDLDERAGAEHWPVDLNGSRVRWMPPPPADLEPPAP